jgi:anti-sigma factor RsiW
MNECRNIQDQLSLFSDGLLPPEEHAAIRAHLRECPDCGGILADLERIIGTARELGPVAPPEHVWLQVAGSVRLSNGQPAPAAPPAAAPRRSAMWQWAGLAAALVLVTLALSLFQSPAEPARELATDATPVAAPATSGTPPQAAGAMDAVNQELDQALDHYTKAIAELETLARAGGETIGGDIATTVAGNLTAIDDAIAESRAAFTANPDSEPARDSLFEALRRKVTVLQATASLINEMRQGDQEGAARAAESLGNKS